MLSQSLLAAAIDPNDAFEVAREIERELLRAARVEVDRRELRRLVAETLVRTMGERVASRYLVWRTYQEPERPMILLLGGAAGVGKTSLALEVAHRLGIGRVLLDRLDPPDHAHHALARAGAGDPRLLVRRLTGCSRPTRSATIPVVEGFRAQATTVSVGVRASVDRAIAENTSMVIDGVSIVPGLLDLERLRRDARRDLPGRRDARPGGLQEPLRARGPRGGRSAPPHRYLENLDAILRIQDHFLELAERHDVPIVDNVSLRPLGAARSSDTSPRRCASSETSMPPQLL